MQEQWLGENQVEVLDIAVMRRDLYMNLGVAILHANMKLAFLRPAIILIENVAAFRTHEQWGWVRALGKTQLMWRYLAIYRNTLDQKHPTPACRKWIHQYEVSLSSSDILPTMSQVRQSNCELTPKVMSLYNDPKIEASGRPEKMQKHRAQSFHV